jgi:hypothetical protein
MEKLLDLLQEFYWENRKFSNENWLLIMINWVENLSGAYAQTYIISLQGWFIKWLVENDKIDFNKDALVSLASELWCTARDEKIVLMVLSISDTPIEDLLLYLK